MPFATAKKREGGETHREEHPNEREAFAERRREAEGKVVPLTLLDEDVDLILCHFFGGIVGLVEKPRGAERLDHGGGDNADERDELQRKQNDCWPGRVLRVNYTTLRSKDQAEDWRTYTC